MNLRLYIRIISNCKGANLYFLQPSNIVPNTFRLDRVRSTGERQRFNSRGLNEVIPSDSEQHYLTQSSYRQSTPFAPHFTEKKDDLTIISNCSKEKKS